MARVSIKDVANRLGVSTATVSLVLNGKDKDGRVSENMAEKIRKEAKAMNYKPNNFARALRSGRSETIGLIIADISNPFFSHLAFHIQEHAERFGYSVIITNTNEDTAKMGKMISVLKSRQVDGFIIVPTENGKKYIDELLQDQFPLVLLDRYFSGINVSYVGVNNFQASMQATDYLLKCGCKRIALVIYKTNLRHMQERRDGYVAALAKYDLYDSRLIKEIDYRTIVNDMNRVVFDLMAGKEKIDGFFFSTNTISTLGLKKLAELNIKTPDDIKAVCFDKNDAFDFPGIAIPFVQQPIHEMGKRAVELLIEQMTRQQVLPVHEELTAILNKFS
ncbi:MAG: LacI family transcriptional regulator [Bacteroidales bacterium]|jgi:LacI family transcriptional regulator|nr:LacI family transcriptional regulator [Bacteroidales bacterium]